MIKRALELSITFSLIFPQSNKIDLQINLNKYEFIVAEPIWLSIYVSNNTEYDIIMNFDYITRKIKIEDSNGKFWKRNLEGNLVDYKNFKPGQNMQYDYELKSWFGKHDSSLHINYFPPGDYQIQVVLKQNLFKDTDRFSPKKKDGILIEAHSNKINFTVHSPKGENIIALQYFDQGVKYLLTDEFKPQLALTYFDTIINYYQNNIYREEAMMMAGLVYRYSNIDSLFNISINRYERLLHEYPNSLYYKQALGKIINRTRSKNDKSTIVKILKKVALEHPNTKAGNKAQEYLNRAINIPENEWDFRKLTRKR